MSTIEECIWFLKKFDENQLKNARDKLAFIYLKRKKEGARTAGTEQTPKGK